MSCSRCGSDDHSLSGCKWPTPKPHLIKHKKLWYCGTAESTQEGIGYTPADAWFDWADRTQYKQFKEKDGHAS